MAGFTSVSTDATTTDASSFTSSLAGGIPTSLLVVLAVATDCVEPNPVVTDVVAQPNAISFTKVGSVTFGPSIHTLYCYVANRLLPNNANRQVTINYAPTTATGSILQVFRVNGMYKAGPAAIRQFATNPDGAGGIQPTAVFPVPLLTTNSYVAAMANLTNPNTTSGPLGASPQRLTLAGTGIATPTAGYSAYSGVQGLTAQTLTWSATSATTWGTLALEFDTTAYTSTDTPQFEAGIGV